jgi:hypothetical protein
LDTISSELKELNHTLTFEMSTLRDSMRGMGDRLEEKMVQTHNKLDDGFAKLEMLLKA